MATNVSKTGNLVELGPQLQKIITRLMENDNLVNLLYYNDMDPLNQPHLTKEQKRELIFNKLIKIVPRVGPKETANSLMTMRVASGQTVGNNKEFMTLTLSFEVFIPLTQWIVKDENLRPFLILGEITKSLKDKDVKGLGRIVGGDFTLNFLTDELGCYEIKFYVIDYA